jgi:hypothetical protein
MTERGLFLKVSAANPIVARVSANGFNTDFSLLISNVQ